MRDPLSTAVELAGFALIVVAAFTVGVTVGLFTAGFAAILVGGLLGRQQ